MIVTNSFKEERKDGRIIEEKMSAQDIINKGWGIAPITAISWKTKAGNHIVRNKEGILAEILPDRTGVVGLFSINGQDVLKVINSDGSERFELPNSLVIGGNTIHGSFEWFEPSTAPRDRCFGVVFRDHSSALLYQLDIDANSGLIVSEKICN